MAVLIKSDDALRDLRALKHIDRETDKVMVKGKNVDPLKVIERVQRKIKREVELLSPVAKPLTGEGKKPEQEEPPKHEEKKDEVPLPWITVVLEVPMHCEACA
ncbi:putative heavy metal-associated isoprenylated plant protein/8/17/18/19 [Helianthus annuus]|nr:putative heavy metal-associated isoprenylated plant protein/8/17/18/19 [Helianthus annuus]